LYDRFLLQKLRVRAIFENTEAFFPGIALRLHLYHDILPCAIRMVTERWTSSGGNCRCREKLTEQSLSRSIRQSTRKETSILPTQSTIPLILLLVYIWHRTRGRILPAVVFTSVFSAASALNFGSLGISCWLFALLSFGAVRLLLGHRTCRVVPGCNRTAMLALFLFVSYAAFSGIVFPFLFAGKMVARVSTPGPLAWGYSNFAQLCYLLASCVIYLIALSSSRSELEDALEWYVRGCVFSAAIASYQLLSAAAHLPFPSTILYSNKSYVIFPAYQINGLWRLNSTFTEASDMAGFMIVGIALLGWTIITCPLRFSRICAFALLLFSLLMTESTVGYTTLFLLVVTGSLISVSHFVKRGTLAQGRTVLSLTVIVLIITIFCVSSTARRTAQKALETTIFQKQNSDSYRARNLTHTAALQALANTDYLGAGWGSVRSSGLLYVLLGNTGILGLSLFLLFIGSLFLPLFRRRGQAFLARSSLTLKTYKDPPLSRTLFAMMMLLVTMAAAGSEIGDPILWVLFALATLGDAPPVTDGLAVAAKQRRLGENRQGPHPAPVSQVFPKECRTEGTH
jgi:hypothetical protein